MFVNKTLLYQVKSRLRNWLKLRDMAEKLRNKFTKVGADQLKEGIEFKKILVLMRTLFENWEERNKFLAKRFFIRKWYMQVKNMKQRDSTLEDAMKVIDKKYLTNSVITFGDICQSTRVANAVPVARARDFFTNLRKIWGDWDRIRRRILDIMSKYLESEEEKRMNYLRRKLLQWKDKSKHSKKDTAKLKVARWIEDKYKFAIARKNWKDLSDKYDMFVNNTLLYQVKSRLRNWLKLRDMAEKIRFRLTKAGNDQLKEGIEFKKILVLMRTLFENWEERNKFLAKRFFVRKWYMQVKKMKQRDSTLDNAMKLVDKKYLTNSSITLGDICQSKRVTNAIPVARARDFFTNIKRIWGDWDKIRRRILDIMGNYFENEEEKRMNYLRRKLLQWKDKCKDSKN